MYSKRVMIMESCKELVPNWLRFVKGVVDCEDLPLNISRENYQDSQLIGRIRNLLTKRVIKMLQEKSAADEDKYQNWFSEF